MTLTVIKFGGGYNRMERSNQFLQGDQNQLDLQGDQTNPS